MRQEMEPYKPDVDYVYPSKTDVHMMEVKVLRDVQIDKDYPFLDKSFRFRFLRLLLYAGAHSFAPVVTKLCMGDRIEGRELLGKHRKLLENGAMTVSNHIHRWDFVLILRALRYRMMYFPAWKENLKGPDAVFVRHIGGIPIPSDITAIKNFNKAFDELHEKKKWLHTYAEGSLFFYYQPIRPFKKGSFTLAHRYNLPVIPLAFSYRKPVFPYTLVNRFRALLGNQQFPMITLRVGEPLLFDSNLPRKDAVSKMRRECHAAVVRLAGLTDNPFPPEGD
jgi:1-acyl-sn-glycerol-3-phosphate acyltransferase